MKWFIIMIATMPNGHEINTDRLSTWRYASHAACMVDASRRAEGFASVGVTGRFLCMYHNEPDREIEASRKGEF